MSDKENFEETVEIPESAPEDFGSKSVKKGMSPALKFGVVIAGVFVVLGGSLVLGSKENADPTSSIDVNADLDATPGGEIQSESPRFQSLLEEANAEAAQSALEEKRTFIPTPERVLEPIDDLVAGTVEDEPEDDDPIVEPDPEPETPIVKPTPVVTVPPAPVVQPAPVANTQPAPTAPTTTEQQENPYTQSMIAQMGSMASLAAVNNSLQVRSTGREEEGLTGEAAAPEEGGTSQVVTDLMMDEAQDILIPAGQIIYAETVTSTNSDASGSPVLVELTTGEYRGSRLIGGFTVNDTSDGMVVEFSTMTLPDGTSVGISAYAVDGLTAETTVASDVDPRYLKRYGALLASSFITSFASAKADTEETITSIGDEIVVVDAATDAEQALYAGLSAAASAIGSDIASTAPSGPLVTLRDNWPLAILFMDPVTASN